MSMLDELRGDMKRVTAKPGTQTSTFMDNFVAMPESDGVIICRILPPKSGRIRDLFCSTRLHNINRRKVHCPREIQGERWMGNCPICDYYNWLWKESDKLPNGSMEQEQLRGEARELKPNERYYYNVVVVSQTGKFRNDQANKLGVPLILSVGKQVHGRILTCMLGNPEEMQEELGEVFNVDTGRNFKIVKKSKKGGDGREFPDYTVSFLEPSKAGTAQQVEQWLGSMHDLQALRLLKPAEELKREIRIHKKIEQDENSGFDPREYEAPASAPAASYSPAASYAPAPASKPAAAPAKAEPTISADDAALLEDEFLKSLNG
jgi:hypothetical protein